MEAQDTEVEVVMEVAGKVVVAATAATVNKLVSMVCQQNLAVNDPVVLALKVVHHL